jgi:hypothetical protein
MFMLLEIQVLSWLGQFLFFGKFETAVSLDTGWTKRLGHCIGGVCIMCFDMSGMERRASDYVQMIVL